MMKRIMRIVLIVLLIVLMIAVGAHFLVGIDMNVKQTTAELYVNEKRSDDQAIIYWQAETARFLLPVSGLLEGVGGQIQQGALPNSGNPAEEILIGDDVYFLYGTDLYSREGELIAHTALSHIANADGLYISDDDYEDLLKLFDFHHTEVRVDTQNRIVRVTAEK